MRTYIHIRLDTGALFFADGGMEGTFPPVTTRSNHADIGADAHTVMRKQKKRKRQAGVYAYVHMSSLSPVW